MTRRYLNKARTEELKEMFHPIRGGFYYDPAGALLTLEDIKVIHDFYTFYNASDYIPWLKSKLKENTDNE